MGYKMGLNGVDNAKLTFDNVRGDMRTFYCDRFFLLTSKAKLLCILLNLKPDNESKLYYRI